MVLLQKLNVEKRVLEFGNFHGSSGNEYRDAVIKIPVVLSKSSDPEIQYVSTDTDNYWNNRCVGEIRKNVFYPKFDIIKE